VNYLRLLFWLKWKLMWRGYRRSLSAVAGVILSLLLFMPMAVGIALGCAFGFEKLLPPYNEHLLRGVLLAIYLFWVLGPLLGYALSDSYDITKLLLYPLSARQIFTGAILGSLIDFPVLLLLPTLLAALIGFAHSALALPLALLALGLFLFHTLSLSQALILASAGVLRSRRFRDVATLLIPLFWMGYYVLTRVMAQGWVRLDWARFLQSPAWEIVSFLPPGLAARTLAAAARGDTALSLGFLAGLMACTAATLSLAGWLIERVYAGEGSGEALAVRRQRSGARSPAPARARNRNTFEHEHEHEHEQEAGAVASTPSPPHPFTPSPLPPVVAAVAEKELRYMIRDPYFKIALMNLVYLLFVGAFAFLGRPERAGSEAVRPFLLWGASGFMLLSEMQLLFNSFGTEGAAAATLFLFPSSRRQILLGKNLALFAALSTVNLFFLIILATLAGGPPVFGPLFCWMELATILYLAVGNLVSIWFPMRVVLRGWRIRQQYGSRGCGYGFLYLAISAASFVLLLPVLAALLLPTFWVSAAWYALAIPLAIAYAAGLYALSLRLAEPLLLQREPILIARLSQEES
jgi:ABC-2 type transport system permease protein